MEQILVYSALLLLLMIPYLCIRFTYGHWHYIIDRLRLSYNRAFIFLLICILVFELVLLIYLIHALFIICIDITEVILTRHYKFITTPFWYVFKFVIFMNDSSHINNNSLLFHFLIAFPVMFLCELVYRISDSRLIAAFDILHPYILSHYSDRDLINIYILAFKSMQWHNNHVIAIDAYKCARFNAVKSELCIRFGPGAFPYSGHLFYTDNPLYQDEMDHIKSLGIKYYAN